MVHPIIKGIACNINPYATYTAFAQSAIILKCITSFIVMDDKFRTNPK